VNRASRADVAEGEQTPGELLLACLAAVRSGQTLKERVSSGTERHSTKSDAGTRGREDLMAVETAQRIRRTNGAILPRAHTSENGSTP